MWPKHKKSADQKVTAYKQVRSTLYTKPPFWINFYNWWVPHHSVYAQVCVWLIVLRYFKDKLRIETFQRFQDSTQARCQWPNEQSYGNMLCCSDTKIRKDSNIDLINFITFGGVEQNVNIWCLSKGEVNVYMRILTFLNIWWTSEEGGRDPGRHAQLRPPLADQWETGAKNERRKKNGRRKNGEKKEEAKNERVKKRR